MECSGLSEKIISDLLSKHETTLLVIPNIPLEVNLGT